VREIIKIEKHDVIPDGQAVLALQGIPSMSKVSSSIRMLFDQAIDIFAELAQPVGIYQKADNLAFFATTVGQGLHDSINKLFVSKDFALGSMLDSVASAGVEKSADVMEAYFLKKTKIGKEMRENIAVMRYSPGYCGWHVSGQRKLFEYLKPEEIGITLRSSHLMEPLKSASGVFIAGTPEIHLFSDNYAFCGQCDTHECRKRMSSIGRHGDGSERAGQPTSIDKHRKE
jgi:hypothetical protein